MKYSGNNVCPDQNMPRLALIFQENKRGGVFIPFIDILDIRLRDRPVAFVLQQRGRAI